MNVTPAAGEPAAGSPRRAPGPRSAPEQRAPEPAGGPEPLRRALLAHYDRERRDLPWRGETDPYRVLVSEVMLQQTRVATVQGYYGTWLRRFPDLQSLAEAQPDEVLEAWEGLGYYRRARNLQRAARVVRERPDRALPSCYDDLRRLPGVGEYTAGAVASIAFGQAVPAVDGNARRVLARIYDVSDPKPAWLRDTAAALVDPDRPGDWNQALMDLGATSCSPARPACGSCPLEPWCAARARGTQQDRPSPRRKREVPRKLMALAVFGRGPRVMLARRPADGLLGGMWAFPEREVWEAREGAAAVLNMAEAEGLAPLHAPAPLPAVEHRFTHLYVTYFPWALEVSGGPDVGGARNRACPPGVGLGGEVVWIVAGEPVRLALPVAQRRVLDSRASVSRVEAR